MKGETIPDQWIAVLNPESSHDAVLSSVTDILGGVAPKHTYKLGRFQGYSFSAASDLVDTGIYVDHPEFEGRASFGASFVDGDDTETDGNGHGTHVAGTTGSATYGVAKKTNLVAVKVLDAEGSGALSQVIAGLQWAVDDATANGRIGKAVANMSLGALRLPSSSVNAGLFLAVAAGNSGLPVSLYSPASEASARRVRARASTCLSTWNNGSTALLLSGTSMAAPHVAGLGAYLLALEGGARDPAALCARVQALATAGAISDSLSANNLLAYNGNAE
ncbi:oryzin precursor [Xylariomycetidae sp. FL2044]|nr:oryzin precursor [Xylariomycetidae sp. FL2044]